MSKVKLTLTIEESLLAYANEIAQERRLSLSEMIEEFLESSRAIKRAPAIQGTTKAQRLRGLAKPAFSGKSSQEIKEMMHKERHGL